MMTNRVTQKVTRETISDVWMDLFFRAPLLLPMPDFLVVAFMVISFSFIDTLLIHRFCCCGCVWLYCLYLVIALITNCGQLNCLPSLDLIGFPRRQLSLHLVCPIADADRDIKKFWDQLTAYGYFKTR